MSHHRELRAVRAMTLIELLTVISILAILMTFVVGSFQNLGSALDITNSIQQVSDTLNLARQKAVAKNQYSQVRFYKPAGSTEGYTAIGIYQSDSPLTGSTTDYANWQANKLLWQEDKIARLPNSCSIIADAGLSPLIGTLTNQGQTGTSQLPDGSYDWVAFYFKPDGAMGMDSSATGLSFSICQKTKFIAAGNKLPPNYAVVTLDRLNGRVQVVRP